MKRARAQAFPFAPFLEQFHISNRIVHVIDAHDGVIVLLDRRRRPRALARRPRLRQDFLETLLQLGDDGVRAFLAHARARHLSRARDDRRFVLTIQRVAHDRVHVQRARARVVVGRSQRRVAPKRFVFYAHAHRRRGGEFDGVDAEDGFQRVSFVRATLGVAHGRSRASRSAGAAARRGGFGYQTVDK